MLTAIMIATWTAKFSRWWRKPGENSFRFLRDLAKTNFYWKYIAVAIENVLNYMYICIYYHVRFCGREIMQFFSSLMTPRRYGSGFLNTPPLGFFSSLNFRYFSIFCEKASIPPPLTFRPNRSAVVSLKSKFFANSAPFPQRTFDS